MNLFLLELLRYLFIVLLYFFIYKIITIISKDISSSIPENLSCLTVLKSECKDFSPGNKFPLSLPIFIGKGNDCHIVINNSYISNKHVHIFIDKGKIMITDPGSTNGTKLNDSPLMEMKELNNGDKIDLGGAILFEFKHSVKI